MTTITFKNGLPLLLQPAPGSDIGLVAADSGCCCPPPPPERCWCGSDCSYFIRVIEPLSVTNGGYDCVSGDDTNTVFVEPGLLQAIIPVGGASSGFLYENYSGAYAGPGLSAGVTDEIVGFPTFLPPDLYYFQLRATRSARISVFCVIEAEQPKYYATIYFSVNVVYIVESLGFTPLGSWVRNYEGTFEVPSTCVVSPERECYPELLGSTEFRRINTPLEITLSGDGTSSLGNLTMTNDGGSTGVPPDFPYAKDAVDAILEESNYTFRITARENCLPPENVCCCLENTVTVSTAEECDGTTSPIADPIVDLEDITIVVDWDGLTLTLDFPYFSGSALEAVDFSCQPPGVQEAFNATQRVLLANFFPQNSTFGQCRWFSSNINAFFNGKIPSNNFDVLAQSSQLTPYVGECKLMAPVDEDDTSCTFTQNGFWCMDNPFSDTVTVEMIIAP